MRSLSRNAFAGSVRLVLSSVLIATAVVVTAAGLRFVQNGGRVLSVQTGSMRPTIRPGDGLIVWRVPKSSLHIGQIVSYRSAIDNRVIVSHRIVAILAGGQLVTKGDALNRTDPPITTTAVVGRARAVAPGLGRFLGWLRRPIGLAVAIYLPAMLIITDQIRRMIRASSTVGYRLQR